MIELYSDRVIYLTVVKHAGDKAVVITTTSELNLMAQRKSKGKKGI